MSICLALLVAALWGIVRGPWRATGALVCVLGALVLGHFMADELFPLVSRMSGLGDVQAQALAWALLVFGGLALGALLLRLAAPLFKRMGRGGAGGTLIAGLAGGLQAAVLLLVLVHGVMGWPGRFLSDGTALSRTGAENGRESEGPSWREQLQGSTSGRLLVDAGKALEGPLALPAWIEEWMARARASLQRGE
jgi:hypothetical protein